MRHPIAAIILSLSVAAAACADRVVAPSVPELTESRDALAAAAANGATRQSGVDLFVNDYSEYFDCLGEMVHMHMEAQFRWSVKTTPSGNVIALEPLLAGEGTGHAEGLVSGRVWTATHFVGPLKSIAAGAAAGSFGLNIDWASPAGPDWALHDTYHVTVTPGGTVTTDRFLSRCVLKGPPA